MPLIKINKPKKEKPYIFTHCDKLALEILPEEQVKSANHNEELISKMLEDEQRDASPEHTRQDIYKALELRDPARILAATKNLTVAERNKIVQGIYQTVLARTKDNYLYTSKDNKVLVNEAKLFEDIKRILLIEEEQKLDLFDLCIKLDKLKLKLK